MPTAISAISAKIKSHSLSYLNGLWLRLHSIGICTRSVLRRRVIISEQFFSDLTELDRHDIDEVRGMRYTLQYNFTFHSDKGFIIDPVSAVATPFIRALDRAVCK